MPAAENGGRRNAGVRSQRRIAIAFTVLIVVFAGLAASLAFGTFDELDTRVYAWPGERRNAAFDAAAASFAWVGRWWVLGSAALVGAALLFVTRHRRDAAYLLATVVCSGAVSVLLKLAIRRTTTTGGAGGMNPSAYAFPSGHTTMATALAAALILVAWPTRWRWPVLVAGSLFALGMGLSRLYTWVHLPSDVAGGFIMGAAVALGVRLLIPAADGGSAEAPRHRRSRRSGTPDTATPGRLEVVFLDWGDTLMVDDRAQSGPMASWPEVRAVDGAEDALRGLRPRFRVLVATNADDSGERDVLAALARVGLDGFVDGVVSSRDVGARKPDALFFRAALLRAGRAGLPLRPDGAVMVGDSWANDVAGAQAAGLRAVWLNPAKARRPPGAAAPDAEIRRLSELPQALAKLEGAALVAPPRRAG